MSTKIYDLIMESGLFTKTISSQVVRAVMNQDGGMLGLISYVNNTDGITVKEKNKLIKIIIDTKLDTNRYDMSPKNALVILTCVYGGTYTKVNAYDKGRLLTVCADSFIRNGRYCDSVIPNVIVIDMINTLSNYAIKEACDDTFSFFIKHNDVEIMECIYDKFHDKKQYYSSFIRMLCLTNNHKFIDIMVNDGRIKQLFTNTSMECHWQKPTDATKLLIDNINSEQLKGAYNLLRYNPQLLKKHDISLFNLSYKRLLDIKKHLGEYEPENFKFALFTAKMLK